MQQAIISYSYAKQVDREEELFQLWIDETDIYNESMVDCVHEEWRNDRIRLILPQTKVVQTLNHPRKDKSNEQA